MKILREFSVPRIQLLLAITPVRGRVLAESAKVSQAAISRYLNGSRIPTVAVATRIAACLGFGPKDAMCLFDRITFDDVVQTLIRTTVPGVQR